MKKNILVYILLLLNLDAFAQKEFENCFISSATSELTEFTLFMNSKDPSAKINIFSNKMHLSNNCKVLGYAKCFEYFFKLGLDVNHDYLHIRPYLNSSINIINGIKEYERDSTNNYNRQKQNLFYSFLDLKKEYDNYFIKTLTAIELEAVDKYIIELSKSNSNFMAVEGILQRKYPELTQEKVNISYKEYYKKLEKH